MDHSELMAKNFAEAVWTHEIEQKISQAICDHQNGDMEKAAQAYVEVLSKQDDNLTALNNLSLLVGDEQAIGLLKKALSLKPDYVDALVNICSKLVKTGAHKEASSHLADLEKIAPVDGRIEQIRQLLLNSVADEKQAWRVPVYSVIVPTHRRSQLLSRALTSIKAQSAHTPMEIIVVSDCVDKQTDAVCRKILTGQDTYIRRSGAPGPSASRNLALQVAKGQFVLFLDDDDAWHQGLVASLDRCEKLQSGRAVYFDCSVVKERRTPAGPERLSEFLLSNAGKLTQEVYVKNQVHMSCFAFPRHVLQGIEFDPHMRAYEDWDFLLSVFDRQMPEHLPVTGSQIHEVDDETTDRRGSSQAAKDFNAVLDYIYVYRRHDASDEIKAMRAGLIDRMGIPLSAELL